MRLPLESINLIQGDAIPNNSVKTYRDIFPLSGEGWHRLRIAVHNTVVFGTATDPTLLGGYNIIRNITLRTSKNEILVQCPALSLYYLNWMLHHVEPAHDDIAAADAEYTAIIDIPFTHPLLARREDLILDSGRYSSIELELTVGNPEHLFGAGAEGTATVAVTVDISLTRGKGCFEKTGKPLALPYIKHIPPYELIRGYTDIESAEDLTLFGFLAVVQDMAAEAAFDPCAGVPYSGNPEDNMDDITFRDNVISYLNLLKMAWFRNERDLYFLADNADAARLVGIYPYIFIQEGSIFNGYWAGQKSEIRLENNVTPLAGTDNQVDVIIFGMRQMRG